MEHAIRKILVVGGGTAGWLSACYLERVTCGRAEVTLLESSTVTRIGVGEATIPSMRRTLAFLGLAEEEWMPACGAAFKLAIRYVNWLRRPVPGDDHVYYHPYFGRGDSFEPYDAPFFNVLGERRSLIHAWLHRHLQGDATPLAEALWGTSTLCAQHKAPRCIDDPELALPYSYHLDAGLFAEMLRTVGTRRGVRHVIDHVRDVVRDERGFIRAVRTERGAELEADLFIDCTGFRGLLINEALGEPFLSDNDVLLNDRAVALQVPYRSDESIDSCTTARALDAGWAWNIPLRDRTGSGYVYCSQFLDAEGGERELRRLCGGAREPANHIKMRVGRTRNAWVNNCVAIGLAGAFIEPLESTGIYLAEYGLAMLASYFPDRHFDAARIRRYNEAIRDNYEELRDFVALHYAVTQREDTPYWRAVRHEMRIPDSLQEKLEYTRENLLELDQLHHRMFSSRSYACILAGMERLPSRPTPMMAYYDEARWRPAFARIAERTAMLSRRLPTQREYLRWLEERADAGARAVS